MINSYIPEKIDAKDAVYEMVFSGETKTKSFNWLEYLPLRERQYWIPFCVTFSRLDCAEAVGKKEGVELNLSDRRLAVESGTTKTGNSLNKVAEYFRKVGTDTEEDTPLTERMIADGWNAWEDIYNLPEAGKRYLGGNHSWVFTKQAMIDSLNYSPLQIAVGESNENWERNGEVQNPTKVDWHHAVTLYHIDEAGRYLIRDTIGKEFKILNKDYPIKWCKSFRDLPTNWKENMQNDFIKILKDKNSKSTGFYIPATSEAAFESMAHAFNKAVPKTEEGKIDWEEVVEGEFELN